MSDMPKPEDVNGVPKWLAIAGHLLVMMLVATIVLALSGVVVDALRDGIVGCTYRISDMSFKSLKHQ